MSYPFGLMVGRAIAPQEIPVLVDLGNVNDRATRNCADRLIAAGVGRKNLSIEGFNRVLMRLPPKKADALIKRFRLVPGNTYWQCTHSRRGIAQPGGA